MSQLYVVKLRFCSTVSGRWQELAFSVNTHKLWFVFFGVLVLMSGRTGHVKVIIGCCNAN